MLRRVVLAVLLALLLAGNAVAAEKTYIVATNPNWPPMEFLTPEKEFTGYEVELVNAIAEEMGFKVEWKNVQWDGLFAGLDTGRFDVVAGSVTITDERRQAMEFSDPFYQCKQAVILHKDDDAESTADLKGKTLGAQVSTTGHFAIQNMEGVADKSFDSLPLAVEAAYSGRIDGVVCDEPTAASFVLMNETYAGKLKIAFIIEDAKVEEYGIVFKKGNTELRDIFNEGLKRVREKGIEAELMKKWFGEAR